MHLFPLHLLAFLLLFATSRCLEAGVTAVLSSAAAAKSTRPLSTAISQAQSVSGQLEDANGNDLSTQPTRLRDAESCWFKWDAWSTSTTNCQSSTFTLENQKGETLTTTVFETFKLCDGHPRARVASGDKTSLTTLSNFPVFTGSTFGTTTTVQTVIIPPSGIPLSTITTVPTTNDPILGTKCITTPPQPSCSIDAAVCSELFSLWTAGNFTRNRPPCTFAFPSETAHGCQDCALFVPSVQLIYFPVTMTGNFCGQYETVRPKSTNKESPPIAVISGTTFTSGTAYLSYAGVTVNGCGPTKGPGILALPSSSLSTLRGAAPAQPVAGDIHYSFNFADLAPNPVPWDAWISQATCVGKETQPQCATITQAAYRPGIVYPSQFFEMEPEWRSCSSGVFGIVDPPIALKATSVVAAPTFGGEGPITSSPALPQPGKSSEASTATSVQPSQDPGNSGGATTSSSDSRAFKTTPDTITVTAIHTSWVTGITIEPITRSYLPEITSIDNTDGIPVTQASNTGSSAQPAVATKSDAGRAAANCFSVSARVMISILVGLLIT